MINGNILTRRYVTKEGGVRACSPVVKKTREKVRYGEGSRRKKKRDRVWEDDEARW